MSFLARRLFLASVVLIVELKGLVGGREVNKTNLHNLVLKNFDV